jgi:hypothetical protein
LFFEPWIAKKAEAALNDRNPNLQIKIEKVHISVLSAGIGLDSIKIYPTNKSGKELYLNGLIGSVRIKGFNILKFAINKKINLKSATISNTSLEGVLPFTKEAKLPLIIPGDITINSLLFSETNLNISSSANSMSYSVKKGEIKVYDIHLIKNDTLSGDFINQIDFVAEEFRYVTADSMNSYILRELNYSSEAMILSADSFSIHPNYTDYAFAARYEFRKPRIEIILSNIHVQDFKISNYIRSGKLSSSFIKTGNMEIMVFTDKRKEFRHIDRLTFQDLIYSFPGFLRLDTIDILNGNITYKERAEKANESGYLTFNNINAKIYNITNDSIFRTEKAFLELNCNARLMGKGKIDLVLKSRLFDSLNTFTVKGKLSDMELNEMNPYLENSAYVYLTSGKLDKMDFSFTANNTESNGTMTLIYNGLDLAVKNKVTDDTTAFKERLISVIANIKVIDSNPLPGKEVRDGLIYTKRDTERFLFHYCARSILSGVKSSLLKN